MSETARRPRSWSSRARSAVLDVAGPGRGLRPLAHDGVPGWRVAAAVVAARRAGRPRCRGVALEQGVDRLQPGVARLGVVLVTGRAQRQRDGQRQEVLLARRPRDVRAVLWPQPDA